MSSSSYFSMYRNNSVPSFTHRFLLQAQIISSVQFIEQQQRYHSQNRHNRRKSRRSSVVSADNLCIDSDGQGLCPVSYTHLDVYKRQIYVIEEDIPYVSSHKQELVDRYTEIFTDLESR